MSKQYTVQAPDGKTITLEGPDNATQEEVIAQAMKLYKPQAAKPAEQPTQQTTQSFTQTLKSMMGADPNVRLAQGAGRTLARMGLGAIQYGQYLTGSKVSPTPVSLEPSPDTIQSIGETVGAAIPAALVPGSGLPGLAAQTAIGALSGGMLEQAGGGTGETGAVIGGALPAAGKIAGEAIGAITKKAAPTINRWLQVAPKEMEHGADPGMRIVNEGLAKTTKAETAKALQSALDDAGKVLNTKLTAATTKGTLIDASNLMQNALDTATKTIGKRSDKAFQGALTQVFDDTLKDFPDIDKLTPIRAQQLKIAIGDAIKWHGAAYEGDVNEALLEIYRGLNAAIKGKVPGVEQAQERWGDLYLGSKALRNSMIKDRAGIGTGSLNPLIKMGAKAAAGGAGVAAGTYGLGRLFGR